MLFFWWSHVRKFIISPWGLVTFFVHHEHLYSQACIPTHSYIHVTWKKNLKKGNYHMKIFKKVYSKENCHIVFYMYCFILYLIFSLSSCFNSIMHNSDSLKTWMTVSSHRKVDCETQKAQDSSTLTKISPGSKSFRNWVWNSYIVRGMKPEVHAWKVSFLPRNNIPSCLQLSIFYRVLNMFLDSIEKMI